MTKSKHDYWILSVEAWNSGAVVTDFMRDQVATLRDSDGDLLPEIAREFLAALVFCKIKPPEKGRPISSTAIRESYKTRLFLEQTADPKPYKQESPKQRAITSIADELRLSERKVSEIVHPRKARKSSRGTKAG
jgi:hypothetical protein